jgi:hypothetical protein
LTFTIEESLILLYILVYIPARQLSVSASHEEPFALCHQQCKRFLCHFLTCQFHSHFFSISAVPTFLPHALPILFFHCTSSPSCLSSSPQSSTSATDPSSYFQSSPVNPSIICCSITRQSPNSLTLPTFHYSLWTSNLTPHQLSLFPNPPSFR